MTFICGTENLMNQKMHLELEKNSTSIHEKYIGWNILQKVVKSCVEVISHGWNK